MTYPPNQQPFQTDMLDYNDVQPNIPKKNHSLALPALIVGVISLFFLIMAFGIGMFVPFGCLVLGVISLVIGIVAVVLGEIARKAINSRPQFYKGKAMALIGEICGSISLGIALALIIIFVMSVMAYV